MISFTGQRSQIAKYFKGSYNFVSYDLTDPSTWTPLLSSEVIFLIIPKHINPLKYFKKFILLAQESSIKQIIKINSLGPWRLIHNQMDQFLYESSIGYTNFHMAPLMTNVFSEQYDFDNHVLYDYRNNASVPYLDPKCLSCAIEQVIGKKEHFYKTYNCIGNTNYNILDIKEILIANNWPVKDIKSTSNTVLHDLDLTDPDMNMMHQISKRYNSGFLNPLQNDLTQVFDLESRSFDQFVKEDKHHYTLKFETNI